MMKRSGFLIIHAGIGVFFAGLLFWYLSVVINLTEHVRGKVLCTTAQLRALACESCRFEQTGMIRLSEHSIAGQGCLPSLPALAYHAAPVGCYSVYRYDSTQTIIRSD